jgi:hypothetical protein
MRSREDARARGVFCHRALRHLTWPAAQLVAAQVCLEEVRSEMQGPKVRPVINKELHNDALFEEPSSGFRTGDIPQAPRPAPSFPASKLEPSVFWNPFLPYHGPSPLP